MAKAIVTSNAGSTLLETGTLRYFFDTRIGISCNTESKKQYAKSYFVLDSEGSFNTFNDIASFTSMSPDFTAGDYVYLHPDAKVSRDLVRNSGYSITRDPQKARFIIIPMIYVEDIESHKYNIAYRTKDGRLHFYTLRDAHNQEVPIEKKDIIEAKLKEKEGDDFDVFLSSDFRLKQYSLIPDNEYYKNIILRNFGSQTYVFDTRMKLVPNSLISPETLDVWRRIDDKSMLARLVCGSNWNEYPFTLATFLYAEQYKIRWAPGNNIKMILRDIHFDNYNQETEITKKDIEMLYAYIFHLLGKDPAAAFISENDYKRLPSGYQSLLKKRIAIAPLSIEAETITFGNLKSEVNNANSK